LQNSGQSKIFYRSFEELQKRSEELGRKLGRTSKEYWIKLRRTLKEPSNFLDVPIKFKKKFQRAFERSFEELGKSFDGIFKVLDPVLQSSWKKMSYYFKGETFEFLFERFEPTIFF
jgi:hypothetical protein